MKIDGFGAKRFRSYVLAVLYSVAFVSLFAACEPFALYEKPADNRSVDGGYIVKPRGTFTPMPSPHPTQVLAKPVASIPTTVSQTPLPKENPEPTVYLVQEGDSLWALAEKFRTTVAAIQRANQLIDANSIAVGQELLIPSGETIIKAPTVSYSEYVGSLEDDLATEEIFALGSLAPQLFESIGSEETPSAPLEHRILHNGNPCPLEVLSTADTDYTIIGRSAICHIPIVSYRLGSGDTPLILVGGIHGGYEWNAILLAYALLDHLQQNPASIPPSLVLYIVPNANPDGLYAVTERTGRFTVADIGNNTITGRFNGRNVDLNRNWDCEWTSSAVWRDSQVSGGSTPFSEPESQFLRDFILRTDPAASVFLHSAATGVFASGCGEVDPASWDLGRVYSEASGYPLYDTFYHYKVTGDAGDWLASQGIPSIAVELSSHESLDWNANLAGLMALMDRLASDSVKSESR